MTSQRLLQSRSSHIGSPPSEELTCVNVRARAVSIYSSALALTATINLGAIDKQSYASMNAVRLTQPDHDSRVKIKTP